MSENEMCYPKISIITVSYNAVATIEQTILSVINQTYENIEYIIIDGGSTDGTIDIIKKYEDKIAYWVSEKDKGIYDAMNKGINISKGDIIGIINADDFFIHNNVICNIIDAFKNEKVDILHGNIIYFDESKYKFRIKPCENIENIKKSMCINHPTCFVKKDIYEKFGYFNTKYEIAADYELMLRFFKKNLNFKYINEDMIYFRAGGISNKFSKNTLIETRDISISYGYPKYRANLLFLVLVIKNNMKVFLVKIGIGNIPYLYNEYFRKRK